jgi:hypothetical protein
MKRKSNLPPGPGPGRPKGLQNKSTTAARMAIAHLVDGNVEKLQGWLDEIAEEHGVLVAWKAFMEVIEYHIPKLARTEHIGENGGPIQVTVKDPTRP